MAEVRDDVKASREFLLSRFLQGEGRDDFHERYTECVDAYFRKRVQESRTGTTLFRKKHPFALVAVGGYGRKELSLHSDIDILIVFGGKIPGEARLLNQEVLLPLWDLGLDLGYGIRTIRDCTDLSLKDFQVLTSLLDARFICGHSPIFFELTEAMGKEVLRRKAATFSRWMEEQNTLRMGAYGDATSLLEPHLKEGIGGLRDYHYCLWLGKALSEVKEPRDLEYAGRLSHREYGELTERLTLIRTVRNLLHHLAGRKTDRLFIEHQERIADLLGYKAGRTRLPVERFLGDLHEAMTSVKTLRKTVFRSYLNKHCAENKDPPLLRHKGFSLSKGGLTFGSPTDILADPFLLMEIFEERAHQQCPVSPEGRRLIREFLFLVDGPFRKGRRASEAFLNMLRGPMACEALEEMFESGLLGAYIPEFAEIEDLVQFDTFHIYPVGRHSLETFARLKTIGQSRDILLLDIFADLQDPEALWLAALFHDIGKAHPDHPERGAGMVRKILGRMGYPEPGIEEIAFLIRHHLFLVQTATRRDLGDEKVIGRSAAILGDASRLKMLTLLTWADAEATGPRAWNAWIANLVEELFLKTLNLMVHGELAGKEARDRHSRTLNEVRALLSQEAGRGPVEPLLDLLPPRYLLGSRPSEIVRHMVLAERLAVQGTPYWFEAREDPVEKGWEILFLGKDRPGLFANLAGVLTLNGINILSADIHTWADRTAVDTFRVTAPLDRLHPEETWEKVRRDLKAVFSGDMDLARRLQDKASSLLAGGPRIAHPPEVHADARSSDFFTILEVFADDRMGLLYGLTQALYACGLDIRLAKIATRADQAADIFYVLDLQGQKVDDPERLEEIRQAILQRLREPL